mmetsp:Transcript_128070/g.370671  ORF Transcript_128070/g.370671 Transcript_128070/m.370671 type:complete len:328 (-) Transcript_128070:98-1081(-)
MEHGLLDVAADAQRAHGCSQLCRLLARRCAVRLQVCVLRRGPDLARVALPGLDPRAARPRYSLRSSGRSKVQVLSQREVAPVRGERALCVAHQLEQERPLGTDVAPKIGCRLWGRGPADRRLQQSRRDRRRLPGWCPRLVDEGARRAKGPRRGLRAEQLAIELRRAAVGVGRAPSGAAAAEGHDGRCDAAREAHRQGRVAAADAPPEDHGHGRPAQPRWREHRGGDHRALGLQLPEEQHDHRRGHGAEQRLRLAANGLSAGARAVASAAARRSYAARLQARDYRALQAHELRCRRVSARDRDGGAEEHPARLSRLGDENSARSEGHH